MKCSYWLATLQVDVNRKFPGTKTPKQKVVPDETFGEF
jgi:hypothetical protein